MYAGYRPYKTVSEEVLSGSNYGLMLDLREVNQFKWMTPFMVDAAENGIHEMNVHKANQVLGGGVENFLDYKIKCGIAGVQLSAEELHEVYGEWVADQQSEMAEYESEDMRINEEDLAK